MIAVRVANRSERIIVVKAQRPITTKTKPFVGSALLRHSRCLCSVKGVPFDRVIVIITILVVVVFVETAVRSRVCRCRFCGLNCDRQRHFAGVAQRSQQCQVQTVDFREVREGFLAVESVNALVRIDGAAGVLV